MLKQIETKDMPNTVRGREKSPMRVFADETVDEFLNCFSGQLVEVSGWPVDERRDAIWNASKAARTLSTALFYRSREKDSPDLRKLIQVTRSGERVFMRDMRRKPNPYPGDMHQESQKG